MKTSSRSLKFLLILCLGSVTLSLFEYSVLHFGINFSLYLNDSPLISSADFFASSYPLVSIHLLFTFLYWEIISFFPSKKIKSLSLHLLFFFFTCLFLYYALILPYQYMVKDPSTFALVDSRYFDKLLGLRGNFTLVGSFLFLSGFLFFTFQKIWESFLIFYSKFLLKKPFFLDEDKGIQTTRSLSGNDFISLLRTLIYSCQREKANIALMGIKLKNEIEIINKYGYDQFKRVIEDMSTIVHYISRKGEDQMLHQANMVLSILLTNEKDAGLAGLRFLNTVKAEINRLYPSYSLDLAIGLFGYSFDGPELERFDIEKILESLMWGVSDHATLAQQKKEMVIQFSHQWVENS